MKGVQFWDAYYIFLVRDVNVAGFAHALFRHAVS